MRRSRIRPWWLSTLALGLALAGPSRTADAAELHVPTDYPTIHEAIAAAIADDVIVIAAGEYLIDTPLEPTVRLNLVGAGMQATILRCTVDRCVNVGETESEVSDLAVVSEIDEDFMVAGYPLTLRRVALIGSGDEHCAQLAKGRVENSLIAGCRTGLSAVSYQPGTNPHFVHNVFVDNYLAVTMHFAIISGTGQVNANPYIHNNIFIRSSLTAISNHTGSPSNIFTRTPEGNAFFANYRDSWGFELDPNLNVFGDPGFVDVVEGQDPLEVDPHLLDTSICIDAGRVLENGPHDDIDLDPRPLNEAPDCGLDEHFVADEGETGDETGDETDTGGDTSTDTGGDTSTDTGGDTSTDTGPPGETPDPGGCSCSADPGDTRAVLPLFVLVLAVGRRARR